MRKPEAAENVEPAALVSDIVQNWVKAIAQAVGLQELCARRRLK
jgi:hypothetical protein